MTRQLDKTYLRRVRNEIPIRDLMADILEIPWKTSEGRFRFLCPHCDDFNTATNPSTNLGRCFRCERNFNPIDITMIVKRFDLLQAIAFLNQFLYNPDTTATPAIPRPTR